VPLLLVVAFIVVPLLELYVIIQVGQVIGPWWTILILLADSILGSLLLRSQGRTVWRRFNAVMREGRVPHREILDGVMIIFGGALLLTPGFLTDVLGVLLLLPPTRAAIRRGMARLLSRRLVLSVGGPTAAAATFAGGRWARRRRRADGSADGPDRGHGPPLATDRGDVEGGARVLPLREGAASLEPPAEEPGRPSSSPPVER
jgi:UPF0716 protein FxsA